jgi:broad specificity phosphatase PhoE
MLSVVLLLATFITTAQQPPPASAIFIVRHAERADAGSTAATMMKDDPELSARGNARAKSLAGMLRDAGVRAIYTSELKRTQQTAAPLAVAVGARLTSVPADDVTSLVAKVKSETGNVLIVGHSNTIPKMLAALGIPNAIEIAENEYDNLFVVIPGAPARLLRLRFE